MQCIAAKPLATRPSLARPSRAMRARRAAAVVVRAQATENIYKTPHDPLVFVASFLGWFAPSNIKVPAFGGESLFGAFHASMLENLAHFPQGPAIDDRFWLLMGTWHIGLFLSMTLGLIGVQGRKQGYW